MWTCKILHFSWKRLITKKMLCSQFYLFRIFKSYFNFTFWRNIQLRPNHKISLPKKNCPYFINFVKKNNTTKFKNNFNFQDGGAFGYEKIVCNIHKHVGICKIFERKRFVSQDTFERMFPLKIGTIHWILST